MNLHAIDTGFFKLDGGAMFGVVPKSLWSKQIQADENNLCNWAARCLLIEAGNRLILIDTGLGDKQSEKFFGYYYRSGTATLADSIQKAGYSAEEITDVILTHLHFDHVGGAVKRESGGLVPTFPNAIYWSNSAHWQWAIDPNPREKASFLPENILPIKDSGQLKFIEDGVSPFADISFLLVNGHTEQMMLPIINKDGRKFLFAADLLPSSVHVPLPWVMGYDVRPLVTMAEKQSIFSRAVEEEIVIIFEHDASYEAGILKQGEKGIEIAAVGRISDFL